MSKSELKRQCVMNPLEMAEKITELTNKLAAAEQQLSHRELYFANELAKERQAGRDEVLKELSAQEPEAYLVNYYEETRSGQKLNVTIASLEPREPYVSTDDKTVERREFIKEMPLVVRPQPPKEQ